MTALHMAALGNSSKIAVELLARGADVNAKSEDGRTPLRVAREQGSHEVMEVLRKQQAAMIQHLVNLDVGRLREVLGRAPSPEAVNEDGWTDLHYAAALDLPELVGALLDAGADIAAKLKSDGNDPSARLKQSLGALDLLSDFHRYGYTALHMAALNNARNAALALLARGADVNAKSEDGRTPLRVAREQGSHEVMEVLSKR